MEDRIRAATLTDDRTGEVYELDFNRESVKFAESRGFEPENVGKYPVTGISDIFFYAFRMHHRKISRDFTDKLIDRWGGLPEKLIVRLVELYSQAMTANNIQSEDDEKEKNAGLTLEL